MEDRPRTQNGSTSTRPARAPAFPASPVPRASPAPGPSGGPVRSPRSEPEVPLPRLRDAADLVVAVVLVAVAATARMLPEESVLRLLLTLPVLLFVPGYLLVQMFVAVPRTVRDRLAQGLVALGASLPVVGLLALTTAVVPGGFRPTPIAVVVTGACVLFAVVAYLRRWLLPGEPVPAEARS